MKKGIGLILLVLSLLSLKAQEINDLYLKIDSLYKINKKEECLNYANDLEKLSINLKNDSALAHSYSMQAKLYYKNRKYNKSIKYFEKELTVNTNLAKKEDLAESYYNLGSTCLKIDKPNKAKLYFEKSLDISKKAKFDVMVYANYEALCTVYNKLKNYKLALSYYKKMQTIDEQEYNQSIGLFQRKYFEEKQKTNKQQTKIQASNVNLGKTKKELEENNDKLNSYEAELNKLEEEIVRKRLQMNSLKVQSMSTDNENKEKINYQKNIVIFISIALVVIFLLSLFMYKLFLSKKKMNKNLVTQKDRITEQNFQINNSMYYARKIQNAVLSSNDLLINTFSDNFILFNPREIVSGDFYWFHKEADMFWGAIVDCTGHGVPGAFMSIIGNNLLNSIIREDDVSKPSQLLNRLNQEVKQTLNQNNDGEMSEDGMDMTVVKVDLKEKKITLSLANHTAFIIQNDKISSIEGDIFSIGDSLSNSVEVSFTDFDFEYNNDTKLYMFSDGFQDQFGGVNDKKYNQKRMKEKLFEIHKKEFKEQKEILKTDFQEWKGDKAQIDDVLLVGIKF